MDGAGTSTKGSRNCIGRGTYLSIQQGYKEEEENVRSLMQKLAVKKTELRSIKDMETEYIRVQELFKEEKKKKEQRIAGNKTYLEELQHEKAQEVAKLEQLKTKFTLIESEEK